MLKHAVARCGARSGVALWMALLATEAFAQAAAQPAKIDAGDTAWMIAATGLVLMMSIPGLALFYAGMVRKKNVLATMAQTLAAVGLGSILWVVIGYSLAFVGESPAIGSLERLLLRGMEMNTISPLAKTIPESVFMIYQMTFAVITVALVAGSVADRMRFSAFLWFVALWLLSSMCRSRTGCGAADSCNPRASSTLPAASSCISTPASPGWSRAICSARGAATAPTTSRRSICRSR